MTATVATPSRSSPKKTLAFALLWIGVIGGGWYAMQAYQLAPGPSQAAVRLWPAGVPFALDPQRPTLVLAAHPDCPCTRASLEELGRVAARLDTRVATHVLFYSDPAFDTAWRAGAGWRLASAVRGAALHADPDGRAARALGLQTSGHILLFAPDGRRLFSGGITPARGERGASAGASALIDLATTGRAARDTAPVFGCLLWGDDEESAS